MDNNMYVKRGILVISVDEEIDHHSAEKIRVRADSMMDTIGIGNVVFDFSRTKFMDSSGIGLIMGRFRKARMAGGRICVINLSPMIDRMIAMSGIYKMIDKASTLDEAFGILKQENNK